MYFLLLVYQLAMLTNLIEELDNASTSIDIVSSTISDTELRFRPHFPYRGHHGGL